MMQFFFAISSIYIIGAGAVESWLSAGMGGFSKDQLTEQYTRFENYKEKKLITASSVLLYYFNDDGTFGNWNTSTVDWTAKQFQVDLKEKLGLKAYPCFFCDETIGNCKPLDKKLNAVFANKERFIESTILEAKKFGWDGYSLDMETFSTLDTTQLTQFVIDWGKALDDNGMKISIWVGGPTQYDMSAMVASPYIHSIVTMNTYVSNFDSFQYMAQALLNVVSVGRAGFGLLNYEFFTESHLSQGLSGDQLTRKFPGLFSGDGKSQVSAAVMAHALSSGNTSLAALQSLKSSVAMADSDIDKVAQWTKDKGAYGLSTWASEIPSSWDHALANLLE